MAMGAGLRTTAKALDRPPDPKVRASKIYPDRQGKPLEPGRVMMAGFVPENMQPGASSKAIEESHAKTPEDFW